MFKTSIGCKTVMAVTGILLYGFVLTHMIGNLQIFLEPDYINSYAYKMQSLGPLLWVARGGLLAILVVHLFAAFRLTVINRAARPERYVYYQTVASTTPARMMLQSGLIIFAFLIYHLMHFTLHVTAYPHVDGGKLLTTLKDGTVCHDVYNMVVYGFSIWYVSAVYIVAQVLLGLHIWHGMSSVFQTLGLNVPKIQWLTAMVGPACALVVMVGNIAMPLAVLMGMVKHTSGMPF